MPHRRCWETGTHHNTALTTVSSPGEYYRHYHCWGCCTRITATVPVTGTVTAVITTTLYVTTTMAATTVTTLLFWSCHGVTLQPLTHYLIYLGVLSPVKLELGTCYRLQGGSKHITREKEKVEIGMKLFGGMLILKFVYGRISLSCVNMHYGSLRVFTKVACKSFFPFLSSILWSFFHRISLPRM